MIERILAPNPSLMTGTGTNTYLIDGGEGHLAVIDPGPDDPRHISAILEAAHAKGRIESILVTHSHSDHLPGALPLRAQTGALLYGHRDLPGINRALGDQETHHVGHLALTALDTPGHTDDSLCFWNDQERTLFTGDVIAGAGTVIVDDAPGGLGKYMATLQRLLALGESVIFPGHGPRVQEGHAKVAEYLKHRTMRENQVLDALRSTGPCSVPQLVEHIYTEVPPGLVGMAARNVRAHLWKLAAEGRARETPSGWQAT